MKKYHLGLILGVCAGLGKLKLVKLLVEKCKADVHYDEDYALRQSATNGHSQMVVFLLEKGANVGARDNWALKKSAWNSHFEVLEELIRCGANVSAGDNHALRWAVQFNNKPIVKFLVQNGADKQQKQKQIDQEGVIKRLQTWHDEIALDDQTDKEMYDRYEKLFESMKNCDQASLKTKIRQLLKWTYEDDDLFFYFEETIDDPEWIDSKIKQQQQLQNILGELNIVSKRIDGILKDLRAQKK